MYDTYTPDRSHGFDDHRTVHGKDMTMNTHALAAGHTPSEPEPGGGLPHPHRTVDTEH